MGFAPRSVYIYEGAKSYGFCFGQKKRKIKTISFCLVRSWKSVGFLRRTNHSPAVVPHLSKTQGIMKISILIILSIIMFGSYGCKDKTTKSISPKEQIEQKKEDTISENIDKPVQKKTPRSYTAFVSAESGLNYRQSPKGKVLGKFELNTRVKVIERTKIFEELLDGGKNLKGEWLGIEKEMDTVYVFSEFLSYNFVYSKMNIYKTSPFLKSKDGDDKTAFVNLSESYFKNEQTDFLIQSQENGTDTIELNSNQKLKFLNTIGAKELDSVFIYEMETDSIQIYPIKDLPVIACIDVYGSGYEFGLDLGKNYQGSYNNYAYVGNRNPFKRGGLKPIIWKKIDKSTVYSKFGKLENSAFLSELKFQKSYFYSQKNMDYYLFDERRVVVINRDNQEIAFDKTYSDGEGVSITLLKKENDTITNPSQWTGMLFTDKPPVIVGFQYFSFGCEIIDFLNESELPISVLCDNRH